MKSPSLNYEVYRNDNFQRGREDLLRRIVMKRSDPRRVNAGNEHGDIEDINRGRNGGNNDGDKNTFDIDVQCVY